MYADVLGLPHGSKELDEQISKTAKSFQEQKKVESEIGRIPDPKIAEKRVTAIGFEGTDGSFSCELVQTGIEGTYVKGNYQVYKSALR